MENLVDIIKRDEKKKIIVLNGARLSRSRDSRLQIAEGWPVCIASVDEASQDEITNICFRH